MNQPHEQPDPAPQQPPPAVAAVSSAAAKPAESGASVASASQVATCPHCSRRLRRGEPLKRRATCICPACKKKLWLDPFQRLYPAVLGLDETQAKYVDYLMQLRDLACGAGIVSQLDEIRESMKLSTGYPPSPAQVLQVLMSLALDQCVDREQELSLRELMDSFDRFERRNQPGRGRMAKSVLSIRSFFNL